MEARLTIRGDTKNAVDAVIEVKKALDGIDKELLDSVKASKKLDAENKKLTNSEKKLEAQLNRTKKQLSDAKVKSDGLRASNDKLKNSNNQLSTSMGNVSRSTEKTADLMHQFRNVMLTIATIRFGAGIVRQFTDISDAALNMNAKLTNVTDTTGQMNEVFDELLRQSNSVGVGIETNVDLYQRLARGTAELGTSQEQLLTLTNNISKAFVVSGASAQETRNAIIQLAQGFSAGALRGDEFRSVMEQAPVLIDGLKDSLNVTQGELIKMAFNGELTADKLVTAFTDMGDSIEKQVANIPLTTERAFETLRNNFVATIRESEALIGVNQAIAKSVQFLAENIDGFLSILKAATVALGLYIGQKALGGVGAAIGRAVAAQAVWATATGTQITLTTALTTATARLNAVIKANPIIAIGAAIYTGYELISSAIESSNEQAEYFNDLSATSAKKATELYEIFASSDEPTFLARSNDLIRGQIKLLEEAEEKLRNTQQTNTVRSGGEFIEVESSRFKEAKRSVDEFRFSIDELRKAQQYLAENSVEVKATVDSLSNSYQFAGRIIGLFGIELAGVVTQQELNAKAQAEARELREKANESIQKQIESLTKSNENLQLEYVQLTQGIQAYQDLAIAKISAMNVDEEYKTQLIALTREQWALNQAISDHKDKTLKADNALKKARETIKSLRKEHRPIQTMFQELSESMEAISNAKPQLSTTEYQQGLELLKEQSEKIAQEMLDTVMGIFDEMPSLFGGTIKEVEKEVKDIDFKGMFDDFAAGLNPAIGALQSFQNELSLIDQQVENNKLTDGKGLFYKTGLSAEFALNSMANMAEEGSRSQAKLAAAAEVANLALGISAILTQGQGDPYTAIPRMIAMAAMVASTGTQVQGAFGGSGAGSAEQRQANQGTGTVLGDAGAKSDSMAKALDLIASTNEKIVGINSGMLRSLNAMNNAIVGTATQIAQVGGIGDLGTRASGAFGSTGFIDRIVFGGSKVTDRGIQVLSGSITDAINGDIFQAYEVAKRKGLFGTRRRTNTAALENGITNQIGLIIQSMSDAVLSGAEALGLNSQEIQSALDSYRIEEQRISLKDLTPEEQQAELQAVFSSMFDGLTEFAVPFITQFQQAGEGLGETLSRVSTTVLVFEEAIQSMGLDFIAKQIDPELFAQAAVAISDFAGGMEEFIDGYTTYVSKFLSEQEQMEILTQRVSGVFSDLGLTLPNTREGFVRLMQGLDLTTASGQEAFGTLIGLSGELDSFYSGLEGLRDELYAQIDALQDYIDFSDNLQAQIDDFDMSDFDKAMRDIQQQEAANVAQLEALAEAAGLAGVAEEDLARVHELTARRTQQAIEALRQQAQDVFDQLYGTEEGNLDDEIARLESQMNSSVGTVGQAAENLFDQWEQAIQRLRDYSQSLLIDNRFSPLEADERLQEAQNQFYETLALAQGGDLDAANELTGLASTVLELGQLVHASGDDYNQIFYAIQDALGTVGIPTGVTNNTGGGGTVNVGVSSELQALYDRRAELNDEALGLQRQELANQLAQHVADLASALNVPVFQVLRDMGVDLDKFLGDLAINVADASVETVTQLANLANTLGVEITDLAHEVGADLGDLADAQSLLNDGLESVINGLPTGISNSLNSALRAIETETNPQERERLLGLMEGEINALPAELSNLLAPFFGGVDLTSPAQQTSTATQEMAAILARITTVDGINIANLTGFGLDGFQNDVDQFGLGSSQFTAAVTRFANAATVLADSVGLGGGTVGPILPPNDGGGDDNPIPFQPDSFGSESVIQELKSMKQELVAQSTELKSMKSMQRNKFDEQSGLQESIVINTGIDRTPPRPVPPRTLSGRV